MKQEMTARVEEMRAKVVEAEAEVPRAMAEALRSGNLGVNGLSVTEKYWCGYGYERFDWKNDKIFRRRS